MTPKETLTHLIRSFVDHPDHVVIAEKHDDMGVLLTCAVHPMDMGRVIGRLGDTAHALRLIARMIGTKNGMRISFKIEEGKK